MYKEKEGERKDMNEGERERDGQDFPNLYPLTIPLQIRP